MLIIVNLLRTILNTKQLENENLKDYMRRFKKCKDIIESHLENPLCISKQIKNRKDYKEQK